MINVFIYPFSSTYLSNNLFSRDKKIDRDKRLYSWRYLRKYCAKKNIILNTVDFYHENGDGLPDDLVFVSFNHREDIENIHKSEKFQRKILFQFEPPVVHPNVYDNIEQISKIYDKLYFTSIVKCPKCNFFIIPRPFNNVIEDYWNNSKRKFLTMINANKKPRSKHQELYSERLTALRYFSRSNEIDFYGVGWDRRPYFPYWFYHRAIQNVYKGPVELKHRTLSKYKFAIAFENTIAPGYLTEKMLDCFYVGTVPIYLGAPDIDKYIPKNCFIDMREFNNYDKLKSYLKALTKQDINDFRENIYKFIHSKKYEPFTIKYFTKLFIKAILGKS